MNKYVNISVVAEHFAVSISTVRHWVREGFIPAHTYVKIDNTQRFKLEEIDKALMAMGEDGAREDGDHPPNE